MKNIQLIPSDWLALIEKQWSKDQQRLWNEKIENLLSKPNLAPRKENIFKALELCSVADVKVVILGQDPYPILGHANGLAFSTEDFVQPFPKSLRNIFKELQRSIADYSIPLTGNLQPWAEQGVLLLNTCLTTEIGQANAHKNQGWEELTFLLLQAIFREKNQLVAMLWGSQAQAVLPTLSQENHLILQSSHPSPLSVYRGFDGCNHFQLCNDYLRQNGKKEINWQT